MAKQHDQETRSRFDTPDFHFTRQDAERLVNEEDHGRSILLRMMRDDQVDLDVAIAALQQHELTARSRARRVFQSFLSIIDS